MKILSINILRQINGGAILRPGLIIQISEDLHSILKDPGLKGVDKTSFREIPGLLSAGHNHEALARIQSLGRLVTNGTQPLVQYIEGFVKRVV